MNFLIRINRRRQWVDYRFDQAIAAFAERYADQNEADYAALKKAVDTGRVTAEVGL